MAAHPRTLERQESRARFEARGRDTPLTPGMAIRVSTCLFLTTRQGWLSVPNEVRPAMGNTFHASLSPTLQL